MAGLDSYANGTKETWRGWQWNRIVERLPGWRPNMGPSFYRNLCADKTVLYLCGPDDFDRQVALKKGFRHENLIACDLDGVSHVRSGGGLGISCNLIDAISLWPKDWPLDVIIADFCGGITRESFDLALSVHWSPAVHSGTVLSANFLRGRDAWVNEIRQKIPNHLSGSACQLVFPPGFSEKHRGCVFAYWKYSWSWSEVLHYDDSRLADMGIEIQRNRYGTFINGIPFDSFLAEYYRHANPEFYTYRSGVQYFDSVVMRCDVDDGNVDSIGVTPGGRMSRTMWDTQRFDSKHATAWESVIAHLAALKTCRKKLIGAA